MPAVVCRLVFQAVPAAEGETGCGRAAAGCGRKRAAGGEGVGGRREESRNPPSENRYSPIHVLG